MACLQSSGPLRMPADGPAAAAATIRPVPLVPWPPHRPLCGRQCLRPLRRPPHCGALWRRRWGLTSALPTPPEMVTLGFLLAGGAVVTLTDVLTRWKSPWGHDAPPFPQEPACV